MKDLKFITNGEPHHKPKVYFGCHPDDLEEALPMLGDDILCYSNCVIWYTDEEDTFENREEMESVLDDMQLLVLAVTDRFLTQPSEAKDNMLPYALKSHLPILPIALEPKLGRRFNESCAPIQIIRKFVTDPTETPYEDMLKNHLNSVLVSDELAEKVRNAFDAYVFLSYRKKDRKHAKRLMRLIHENKEFRDIAIWYDEYLIPGKDYHDAIEAAFNKSSLFALAVTPSLLEKDNFVMKTEFPMARDRYEATHKEDKINNGDNFEIVPVELYEEDTEEQRTDREQLSADYHNIPEVEDEHQREKTNAALIAALERIGKKPNDGTSTHRFFIGIAYLNGIDVEPNYGRALELLTSAAEDKEPCYEATEKLVDMYINGVGVAADAYEARRWQKTVVDQYKAEYEKNYSPDEHRGFGTKYFKSMLKLSDLWRKEDAEKAIAWALKAEEIAGSLDKEVGIREAKRDRAMAATRLGALYLNQRDYEKALNHHAAAVDIYKDFVKEIGTTRARRDLSVGYERLGDVYRKISKLSEAEACYNECDQIRENLARLSGSSGARRDLSVIITKLGNIKMETKEIKSAEALYCRALELDRILAAEMKSRQSQDDYAVSLMKLGRVYRADHAYDKAAALYIQAKDIYKELKEKSFLLRYQKNYAACCENLASAYKHMHQPDKAEEQFVEAIETRELLVQKDSSVDTKNELAVSYFNYAAFRNDKEFFEKALAIWEKLSEHYPEYEGYVHKCKKVLKQLG